MVSQSKTRTATAKARPVRSKTHAAAASRPEGDKPASPAQVVVEAGSRSRSSLRDLERGSGPLMHEIGQIVNAVRAEIPGPAPIVIVYREKRSSGTRSSLPFELPLI